MPKRENEYQADLIKRLREQYPGCEIMKNDSGLRQGIPDLTIYVGPRWGMLEVKTSEKSPHQPNQDYYVDHYNEMSFAAFIYPENEKEVLDGLQSHLQPPLQPSG